MKGIIKKYLVVVILILSVTSLKSQQQQEIPWPTLADSPWPMMKHDPQGTGRSPYVGPKTANIIWTMDMPYGILSGPAIGPENNLYFGSRSWLPNDTTNYFYSAYPDGTLRWVYYTGETLGTYPGFLIGSDSTLYFGSQDHFLYAVTLDGKLKWKYDTGDNIWQDIMNTDLEGNIYILNDTNHLYSIKRDGTLNWKVTYESGFFGNSPSISPDGQTLYIAGRDSNLFALNLDGSIKWKYSCGEVNGTPLVDNSGKIYICPRQSPWGLYCLSPDGNLEWNYELFESPGQLSPVIDKDGNIYFYTQEVTENINHLTCVDYYGNYVWTFTFGEWDEIMGNSIIVDKDNTVYFGSGIGDYYYAVSSDGELLWKLPLNGYQVDNTGAIGSDGTLYIGTHLSSTSTGQEKTLIAIRDTGVTSVDDDMLFNEYNLSQNYPNPFNPSAKMKYQLSKSGIVTLIVYDILGRKVTTLVNEFKSAGNYEVNFAASNLPSGVYIYRITASQNGKIEFTESKQMLLMK